MSNQDNSPALVAWVAEHVMGWRKDDKNAFVFYDHAGTMCVVGDHSWTPRCPHKRWNPLADANADFEVLRKVRESASDGERVRFACVLSDIWLERDATAIDSGWWLAHEIGDYTRAAAKAKGWTEQ